MVTIGMNGARTLVVTPAHTARAMGSGGLDVFATPAMIALMEGTAMDSVAAALSEGEGTVGTGIDVKHVAATPVGMAVRCESKLVQVEGRRLVFAITVWDDAGIVGTATHERFIIDNARFMAKANAKASQ